MSGVKEEVQAETPIVVSSRTITREKMIMLWLV